MTLRDRRIPTKFSYVHDLDPKKNSACEGLTLYTLIYTSNHVHVCQEGSDDDIRMPTACAYSEGPSDFVPYMESIQNGKYCKSLYKRQIIGNLSKNKTYNIV